MGVFKNGVGRPSNETIKKRNIFKGICVLLVLIIAGMTVYILNDKGIININNKKAVDNKKDITKESEKKENLDVNSDLVVNLFNKYNLYTWFLDILIDRKEPFSYFYQKDLLNKDVSDSIKFIYSIGNLYLKESTGLNGEKYRDLNIKNDEVLDFDTINNKSVELFNSKININNLDSNINVLGYCFIHNSNSNQIRVDAGCGVGDASSIDMKTKIINAYKSNKKIIIENKLMFTYSVPDYTITKDKIILLKNYAEYDEIDKYKIDEAPLNATIDDYLDKLDTYRWAFKENKDGNYTFESVEKVK